MIKQYFGDEKNLDALLKKENDRLPLPIWTVIDLWEQGINKRKHFYLLINTEKQINNPTHVSVELQMILKLVLYLYENFFLIVQTKQNQLLFL